MSETNTFDELIVMRSKCGDGTIYSQRPLVRCKDCKYLIDHYGFMDDGYCENMREKYWLKFKPGDNWFCADGERR